MSKNSEAISPEIRELINETARAAAVEARGENTCAAVNYYQSMELILRNYNKLRQLVSDYEEYIHVELKGKSNSIITYSTSSGGQYKTQDEILAELEQNKIASYHQTRARFEEVDRVIRLYADRKEFVVVRMYYFGQDANGQQRPANVQAYTWEEIAAELSEIGLIRDSKTARRWRSKIVNDMAVCMFGKAAALNAAARAKTITAL